jgi:hypothetical protein
MAKSVVNIKSDSSCTKRPGIHSKNASRLTKSKGRKKPYRGQGR